MIRYAVYELTPAPWGDNYRFIAMRDTREDAEKIWKVLEETDENFGVYKIVEHKYV